MPEQRRVIGHGLRAEGAAYVLADGQTLMRWRYNTVGGQGYGLCECGEVSPWLGSGAARKLWHKRHKLQVLGAAKR